mgnify:CR=1 FL=1
MGQRTLRESSFELSQNAVGFAHGKFDDFIEEEEGIAVRQDRLDLVAG